MSVSHQLGLEGDSELLARARDSWQTWAEREPRLSLVGFDELRAWLPCAPCTDADDVLHALATLGATDGGDNVAAAAALAWSLLPGACTLARRLRTLDRRIDELVAAQLWIEVRSFPWQRLHKVAANIILNTRAGVLAEAGDLKHLARIDRAWTQSLVVSPDSRFWGYIAAGARGEAEYSGRGGRAEQDLEFSTPFLPTRFARTPDEVDVIDPTDEVVEVLDWACENDVISQQDRDLLLCLVEEAAQVTTNRTGRSNRGLTASKVAVRVAPRCGLSESTVRRRAARSLRALAAASDRFVA